MPAAEGIVLTLESQFDADTIPEAAIPVSDTTLASCNPRLVDVYVPSYLASQFWISYTINPAMLAPAPTQAPTRYIFFKLILDGECIVSWGVGEAEEWKGKTMWAFFRSEDQGGWRTVDKRAFFFRATGDDQDFDILAYRARGRRRVCRQFDDTPPIGQQGFNLVSWGRLKEHHPQNFYQYALLDPTDQPYATFRYHIRGGPHVQARHPCQDLDQSSSGSSSSSSVGEINESSRLAEEFQDASRLRRLSYPPTICFIPTSSRTEPSSPTKLDTENPVPPELDMSILDPEPSVTVENLSESEQFSPRNPQLNTLDQREQEHISSVRKQSVQTPTPLGPEQIMDTPPSSLRRRSGAKIKEWFGSISKRRATRSASPIHPSLSHKTSSASLL